MIDIKFSVTYEGFSLTVKGHAGYAEKGRDIICAGVSALAIALSQTLKERHSKGYFQKFVLSIKDGYLFLKAEDFQGEDEWTNAYNLFYMFLKGVKEIKRLYPGYLSIILRSYSPLWRFADNDTSEQTMKIFREKRSYDEN